MNSYEIIKILHLVGSCRKQCILQSQYTLWKVMISDHLQTMNMLFVPLSILYQVRLLILNLITATHSISDIWGKFLDIKFGHPVHQLVKTATYWSVFKFVFQFIQVLPYHGKIPSLKTARIMYNNHT